ncbi:MAG: TonB-dependent receptor plug domain-containing protein, partial [Pseudomonadota bacterium]
MRAILLAGGFAAAWGTAWAQGPEELGEVLITGGRTPIEADQTGRAFTVITGEQLEAQGTRYIADALRQVPGLAVSRTGSFGGLTQIRVRGAEGNQVLVLVDGMEIAPAGNGEVDFGSLIVSEIERIEVLRGPQSALFGSNAAAGVISIITRRGERGAFSYGGGIEGGSDGTVLLSANAAGGGESWDGALGVRLRRTDGFNVATGSDDRDGEMDGDRNVTITGRANWDATQDLTLGANVFVVDRESAFDDQLFPFPADETTGLVVDSDEINDATDIAVGVFARYEMLDDALVHELRFGYTYNTADSLENDALTFGTESQRFKAGYQASYAFDTGDLEHLVTGLFEFEEELNEASSGFDQSRTLFGLGG